MKKAACFFCLVLVFNIFSSTNLWGDTTDGWELQYPTPQTNSLNDISSIPETEKVIAVGDNGTVMISDDNGDNWNIIQDNDLDNHNFTAVDFADTKNGYISSLDGNIFKTTDQGLSWSRKKSGIAESLSDIDFYDATFGIAVGDGGTIVRTLNSGYSWELLESGTEEDLRSVCIVNNDSVFVAGGHGDYVEFIPGSDPGDVIDGIILMSEDKGNNWHVIETEKVDNYHSIASNADGITIFGAGYNWEDPSDIGTTGYLYKTEDYGMNFNRVDVDFIPVKTKFITNNNWISIGRHKSKHNHPTFNLDEHTSLYRTVDNGDS